MKNMLFCKKTYPMGNTLNLTNNKYIIITNKSCIFGYCKITSSQKKSDRRSFVVRHKMGLDSYR